MVGKIRLLILLGACALGSHGAAQVLSPTPPPPTDGLYVSPPPNLRADPSAAPEFEQARKVFRQFSPEQRAKFTENLQRWKDLSAEERENLRDHAGFRREKMRAEVEEVIKSSGLQLTPDQREVFALRYLQERRKIEEALRKELEQKRKPQLDAMVSRLKTELNAPSSPSPTAH